MLLALSHQWTKQSSFGWARTLQGHLWSLVFQLGLSTFISCPLLSIPSIGLWHSFNFSISWSISFLFSSVRLRRLSSLLLPKGGMRAWSGVKWKEKKHGLFCRAWGESVFSLHLQSRNGHYYVIIRKPGVRQNSYLLPRALRRSWGSERQGTPSGNQKDAGWRIPAGICWNWFKLEKYMDDW